MRDNLNGLIEIFIRRRNMTIQRKALRLTLSGSITIFIAVMLMTIIGMILTWNAIDYREEVMSKKISHRTEKFAEHQARKYLMNMVNERTKIINESFALSLYDIDLMAKTMTNIMQNQNEYVPRILPNALYENVLCSVPYTYYNKSIESTITDDLRREMQIAANFADLITVLHKNYPCVMAASKKGYIVTVDPIVEGHKYVPLCEEPARTNYDARQKNWYKKGLSSLNATFTNVYKATSTNRDCVSCMKPYYDNNGIAGVVVLDCDIGKICEQLENTKVGETGFSFIVNKEKELLFQTRNDDDLAENIPTIVEHMSEGKNDLELVELDGEEFYFAYTPLKSIDWTLCTAISKAEVIQPAKEAREHVSEQMNNFKKNLATVFIILLIVFVTITLSLISILIKFGVKLSKRLIEPIQKLNAGVKNISLGNFDRKIEINTGDEIEHLATCFNIMTDELKNYMDNLKKVTAEKEKIATDLKIATNIQQSMLPKDFLTQRKEFEIYAKMQAAKEVGGDFYDFYTLDDDHLLITMADVSGKGVPAAMFMSRSKTILKTYSMTMNNSEELGALMTLANEHLCSNNDEMMFVTVFIAIIDLKNHKMIYVNGGHNPPMIYHDGEFKYLNVEQNCVLGMMEGMDFIQQEIQLNVGDIIYLYTDGVTEAMDKDNNQYGEKRLSNCLNGIDHTINLQDLLKAVKEDLNNHVKKAEQSDDITMLAVRLNEVKDNEK